MLDCVLIRVLFLVLSFVLIIVCFMVRWCAHDCAFSGDTFCAHDSHAGRSKQNFFFQISASRRVVGDEMVPKRVFSSKFLIQDMSGLQSCPRTNLSCLNPRSHKVSIDKNTRVSNFSYYITITSR